MLELLRRDRRARLFFTAHAQSAIGTGAGYVALLLVAYDRLPGAWGITLVLTADFLPAIVLGPIFGAAADRWSRRACAVVADLVRGVAFLGIALVGGIEATIALALLAGLGAGLFQPAILAGLPSLVDRRRVAPAMSLYGALSEMGTMLGPALAALLLLWVSPEALLAVDGATFLLSAAVLAALPFGGRPEPEGARASLLRDARDGLAAARRLPGVRTLIYASGAVLLFGGMLNVVELLFAKNELDVGDSAFSILIALAGLGIVIGSSIGSRGGSLAEMRYRYLGGLLLVALALIALAVTPGYAVACAVFVAIGVGNGLVLVHGRLLLQRVVPERLLGRIFGIKDAVNSAAFSVSFLSAGLLVSLLGNRTLLAIAGAGGLVVWAVTSASLRRMWTADAEGAHQGAAGVDEPALRAEN
jgi:MFS family permease